MDMIDLNTVNKMTTPLNEAANQVKQQEAPEAPVSGGSNSDSSAPEPALQQPKPKRMKLPAKYRSKKPVDMPRRPLSAYNLFFRDQRGKILEERKTAKPEEPPAEDAAPKAELTTTEKRKQGLFATMAKTIGKRWKEIQPEDLEHYNKLADTESKRYREEMEEYNRNMVENHAKAVQKQREESRKRKQEKMEEDKKIETARANAEMNAGFSEGGDGLSASANSMFGMNLQRQQFSSLGGYTPAQLALALGGSNQLGLNSLSSLPANFGQTGNLDLSAHPSLQAHLQPSLADPAGGQQQQQFFQQGGLLGGSSSYNPFSSGVDQSVLQRAAQQLLPGGGREQSILQQLQQQGQSLESPFLQQLLQQQQQQQLLQQQLFQQQQQMQQEEEKFAPAGGGDNSGQGQLTAQQRQMIALMSAHQQLTGTEEGGMAWPPAQGDQGEGRFDQGMQ
jgi:hypothetical protein